MFPVGDWQFWVVTALAGAGLLMVIRTLWPGRRPKGVELTVGGRPAR